MYRTVLSTSLLSLAFATSAQNAPDARAALGLIESRGYVAPHELEFQYGLWTAEATAADGRRVDLLVDPATGTVDAIGPRGEGALTSAELRTLLGAAGYRNLRDMERDDGLWELEAQNAAGQRVELVVHGVSGDVLSEALDGQPPANAGFLSAAEITARLTAAGYTQIRELEFDNGRWECDARNPQGQWVELKIDGRSGAILREERD